jgi:hypothetical protein
VGDQDALQILQLSTDESLVEQDPASFYCLLERRIQQEKHVP